MKDETSKINAINTPISTENNSSTKVTVSKTSNNNQPDMFADLFQVQSIKTPSRSKVKPTQITKTTASKTTTSNTTKTGAKTSTKSNTKVSTVTTKK